MSSPGIKKKLIELFPINIMKFQCKDEYQHWDTLIQNLKDFEGSSELEIHEGDVTSVYRENWRERVFLLSQFEELQSMVHACVQNYCYYNSIEPLELNDSWFNIMNKGSRVQRHRHEGSVISGTLFVKVPDGSHGLAFSNPTIPYRMYEKLNARNESYSYAHLETVEQGDLLLYPSWLEHFVPPIDCDDRITIGFNTDYPKYRTL